MDQDHPGCLRCRFGGRFHHTSTAKELGQRSGRQYHQYDLPIKGSFYVTVRGIGGVSDPHD